MSRAGAPPGLVICATTAREAADRIPDDPSSLVEEYAPRFPTSQDVDDAARGLAVLPPWDGPARPAPGRWAVARALPMHGPAPEGARARVVVSPGAVAIERRDPARAERSAERARQRAQKTQDLLAAHLLVHGEFPAEPPSRLVVSRWSRRSRNRMTRRLAELDYRPLLRPGVAPAMVTLTYPGDWLTVAPSGAECKRHLRVLGKRYARAWGEPLVGIWKLEFQRRGAPHYHLMIVPPRGRAGDFRPLSRRPALGVGLGWRNWLALNWADIVNHPDPVEHMNHLGAGTRTDFAEGLRHRDPKRISVYFTKHGTFKAKEYQHVVPPEWQQPGCGPGRFWGYWGLRPLTRAAELDPAGAVWAARLMRRYARAQGTTREVRAPRAPGGRVVPVTHDVTGLAGAQLLAARRHTGTRRVRRRVQRMQCGAGWLSLNDGPAFARALTRALEVLQ